MDRLISRLPAIETLLWILASVTALAALIVLAPALFGTPAAPVTPAAAALTATPRPTLTVIPSITSPAPAPASRIKSPVPLPPVPAGAQLYSFIADPTQSGWIATGEKKPHWGDRNLHVGYYKDQTYRSVLYFDITQLSPGSQILFAQLELTGLSRDNLGATGEWNAKLLSPDALDGWSDRTPDDLASTAVQAEIGQTLGPTDLEAGQLSQFVFNPDQLVLLGNAINTNGLVGFRIDGPAQGTDTLFTWDGAGLNLKAGAHPVLRIIAVPTKFIVITNTPTPQNVITAAAQQRTLEARIAKNGTPTPFPRNYATATPVIYVTAQPTPANVETRIAIAQYATAVAQTTGTFTPTPSNWIVVTPVPPTWTPGPTWTPLAIPVNKLTPVVTGTGVPAASLLLKTPIPNTYAGVPVKGNLLFVSDRYGGYSPLMMKGAEPWNLLVQLTGPDLYYLAAAREQYSPDRSQMVTYRTDQNGIQQVGILDVSAGWFTPITNQVRGLAYDAAWSPDGTHIVYVSTETGIDELYIHDLVKGSTVRITDNGGLGAPWTKHPTWSPDGTRIAFKSNRVTGHYQIWVVNADGSGLQNISQDPYNDVDPVWVKN